MSEELKPLPCPFCPPGTERTIHPTHPSWETAGIVQCEGCETQLPYEAWNTRPSPWNSDMSAAPRDGTTIFVMLNTGEFYAVEWLNGRWCVDDRDREYSDLPLRGVGGNCSAQITHWQLPQPPEER